MNINNLKQFFKEVKETLSATKDHYLSLAALLTVFVILLTFTADYLISGVIIVLLYAAVAPFLLALAAYFMAPTKLPLEQKQKYFFRLVKQFYRLDSMRIMIPLRTFFFAILFSLLTYYLVLVGALSVLSSLDPAASAVITQFSTLIQNGANLEQVGTFFNQNQALLGPYLFASELVMIFAFILSSSYMIVKRFFFVFLHINLFNKSKLKVDMIKTKYFNGAFKRGKMRRFYLPSVAPVFLIASTVYIGAAIGMFLLLGDVFNPVLIFTAAAGLYVITLAFFIRYLLSVNIVLFGLFMEQNAVAIYQESINDIDFSVTNPNMSNEDKERLLEVKRLLELQKTLFYENLKNPTSDEPPNEDKAN